MARFLFGLILSCTLVLTVINCLATKSNEDSSSCPCQKKELCNVVTKKYDKELFIFTTVAKKEEWVFYDWEHATTIAVYGTWSPELMCFAHSKGVKVVIPGFFPVANLTSAPQRKSWIRQMTQRVLSLHADGINFDIEGPVLAKSVERGILTNFVEDTALFLREVVPGAQVTFDVPWSPDCIDNRCYDFVGLSKVADFLNIMAYDERSQVRSPKCIAGANTPYGNTLLAVKKYLRLGVPSSSLVFALPWYGYDYTCLKLSNNECYIRHYDYYGVNCSDAVGHEKSLNEIVDSYIPLAEEGVHYDNETMSMFFTYRNNADAKMHQMWFDNPKTLSPKYNNDVVNGLRGKSMFTASCLYYGDDEKKMALTHAVWKAIYEK